MIGGAFLGLPALIARVWESEPPGISVASQESRSSRRAWPSRVSIPEAGGPYLYAKVAFGRFLAIQNGWLTWLSRIGRCSAVRKSLHHLFERIFPPRQGSACQGRRANDSHWISCGCELSRGDRRKPSQHSSLSRRWLCSLFCHRWTCGSCATSGIRVTPATTTPTSADWFEAVLLMIYSYGDSKRRHRNRETAMPPAGIFLFALSPPLPDDGLFIAVQYLVIHTIANVATSSAAAVDSAR